MGRRPGSRQTPCRCVYSCCLLPPGRGPAPERSLHRESSRSPAVAAQWIGASSHRPTGGGSNPRSGHVRGAGDRPITASPPARAPESVSRSSGQEGSVDTSGLWPRDRLGGGLGVCGAGRVLLPPVTGGPASGHQWPKRLCAGTNMDPHTGRGPATCLPPDEGHTKRSLRRQGTGLGVTGHWDPVPAAGRGSRWHQAERGATHQGSKRRVHAKSRVGASTRVLQTESSAEGAAAGRERAPRH